VVIWLIKCNSSWFVLFLPSFIMQREVLIALKVLGRMLAILVAAILSVVAVQRLVLKLYTDIGKRYILIQNDQEEA
jgi:hypothetical protein